MKIYQVNQQMVQEQILQLQTRIQEEITNQALSK